jgi:hypothetical protein
MTNGFLNLQLERDLMISLFSGVCGEVLVSMWQKVYALPYPLRTPACQVFLTKDCQVFCFE